MPKSRKRKKTRRSTRRIVPGEVVTIGRRDLDKLAEEVMTPEDYLALERSYAAEAAGDPEAALEHRLEAPFVIESMQIPQLRELVELGREAPGWMLNRWIVGQAERWLLYSGDPRVQDVVLTAWLAAWDKELRPAMGMSPRAFGTALAASDWVVHQLMGYEYGGLLDFVEAVAGDDLLSRADRPELWSVAAMGGYRLESAGGGRLTVVDLADQRSIETLDVGALSDRVPGATVLGRLVPITSEPGLMFDRRPLDVDAQTATEAAMGVAEEHDLAWIDAIAKAVDEGRLQPGFSRSEPTLLSGDLVLDRPRVSQEQEPAPSGRIRELMTQGCSFVAANGVAVCEVAMIALEVSGESAASVVSTHVSNVLIHQETVDAVDGTAWGLSSRPDGVCSPRLRRSRSAPDASSSRSPRGRLPEPRRSTMKV